MPPNPLHLRSPAGHTQYLRHTGEVTWISKARQEAQSQQQSSSRADRLASLKAQPQRSNRARASAGSQSAVRSAFGRRVHPSQRTPALPRGTRGHLPRTRGEEPRGTPGAGGKHLGFLGALLVGVEVGVGAHGVRAVEQELVGVERTD